MANRKTVVAYDPGAITGVAEGFFSDTEPLQVTGTTTITYAEVIEGFPFFVETQHDYTVCEIFESRANQEFAPDLTGVRVEGILDVAEERNIIWRSPIKKLQVPDSILRDHGLWVTGTDVDWEDGRDANDAINHMLGFVAFDLQHRPTLEKYFV